MHRLLRRADWDVDGLHDDVRDYVVEHPGDAQGMPARGQVGQA